ncbi:dTDP-6-deoxy-L-talose 4-dehydrogenase (NAD+) [Hoeflea marina]|uniref:dTDP-6-deoxy-L-talose 4-dehydrogenase (NAD+) n=1 Tax=Hoeflea marina TaxID=274592 RepID=A0A317PKW8_9HYPH|nr:NAD(P)-dependent oxidoreductase [Hoeflea marina]PWW00315.1 dTDP-6-deoxy-L-talose 4-dehydrogenase (NAD+) [Hoeflea marina]
MKRVALTGATGFVGRSIHRALAAAGHEVVPVIRTGSGDRLAASAMPAILTDDLFAGDSGWWMDRLAGIDAIIHAAWYVEPGKYLDSDRNLDCVSGTLALARGARRAGVGHFIGIGTCMEYRLPSPALAIDSPLGPSTLYGASKLALFEMLGRYFGESETVFSWCRLFYLHGEGEHPARLVPYIRQQLARGETARLSAGTQLRDFLDVGAAGAMIARVIETGQPGAINVCSGQAVTIRQLAERIADESGRRDLLDFGTAAIHPADPASVVGICNATRPNGMPETHDESPVEAADQS